MGGLALSGVQKNFIDKTTPVQIESTNTLEKTTFHFSRDKLKSFAAVAFSEQNSIKGAATELKVLLNLFNNEFGGVYKGIPGERGFYNFIKNGNYVDRASIYMDSGHLADFAGGEPVTDEMIDVAEAVLNEGIGIVPDYVDRIDPFITKDYHAQNPIYDENGKLDHLEDITFDLDKYKSNETHISNIYDENGYTFYGFLDSTSKYPDILGYSSEEKRITLGESCNSLDDLLSSLSSKEKSVDYNEAELNKFRNSNIVIDKKDLLFDIDTKNKGKSFTFRNSMSAGIPNNNQLSSKDKQNMRTTDRTIGRGI